MASSSVSQEDVDQEYDLASRRSKIRSARARNLPGNRAPPPATMIGDAAVHTECVGLGDDDLGMIYERDNALEGSIHDGASPKPIARSKYKPNRPNHLKAKQRDRRKLREKRRSTGVVIMPTESTGGSTGEDDDDFLSTSFERKTVLQSEKLDMRMVESAPAAPSTKSEDTKPFMLRRNKSPSDRDADDEDNEDCDNQSDSILSLTEGQSSKDLSLKLTSTAAANGRPHTPSTENVDELLERAQEENNRLLDLLEQKDKKLNQLTKDYELLKLENERLKDENSAIRAAVDQMSADSRK